MTTRYPERRVALVCGATGALGGEIAGELAADGWELVLHTRSRPDTAERLLREPGRAGYVVSADLTDEQQVREMFSRIRSESGFLSAVVNAGYPPAADAECERITPEEVRAHTDALLMTALVCKHALPLLRSADPRLRRIVNFSGALSERVFPGTSLFSAAAAAITAFSRTLALEAGPDDITVNVVSPGQVDPEGGPAEHDGALSRLEELSVARRGLPRFATAAEVARVTALLLSPRASAITGQNVFLAAGEPV